MRNILFMIILVTVCACQYSICSAQTIVTSATEVTLQVEGKAPVVKNDIARAREEALKSALEKAILQTVVAVSGKTPEIEALQKIKNNITRRVDHYIKNYRITSENIQQNEYIADVDVVVALVPVRNDLLQIGVLKETGEKANIPVSLSLTGIKKYSEYSYLKTFLQNRSKIVKSIYPCSFDWRHVQFDLVVLGDVQNLSAELEKTGKYAVEIPEKSQGVVINVRVKEEVK